MDKPEWCPQNLWDDTGMAFDQLYDAEPDLEGGCEHGVRVYAAKLALSAQSQAYIDAARIAEKHGEKWGADGVEGWIVARDISAAILQRKDEMK